jgi:hypothetical protein
MRRDDLSDARQSHLQLEWRVFRHRVPELRDDVSMKPHVLGLILSIAVAGACLVNNRSDKLACKTQADCQAPRVCEAGYCVVDENACPPQCNGGCDLTASPPTCTITGSGGDSITCPAGHHCDISCTGNACDNITCTGAVSCTVMCTGNSACNNITCGAADCLITCNGTSACNDVTCGVASGGGRSGRCRVTCLGSDGGCNNVTCTDACDCVLDGCANGTCGALSCPRASGNTYCTGTGANGVPCIDTTSGCSC